jgi:hypothetical protein
LPLASTEAIFAFQTTSSLLAESGKSSWTRVIDHRGAEEAFGHQNIHMERVQARHVNWGPIDVVEAKHDRKPSRTSGPDVRFSAFSTETP